jgi:hypothetical protein
MAFIKKVIYKEISNLVIAAQYLYVLAINDF